MSSVDEFQFDELFLSRSPQHPGSSSSSLEVNDGILGGVEVDIGKLNEEIPEVVQEQSADALKVSAEVVKITNSISYDSFTIRSLVGSGAYGKVRQVVKKDSKEIFAMKTLRKKHIINANCVENTMSEKDILRKVKHPFVVRLHYAFQTPEKLYLIMDFVNGGHLLHHLRRETMFNEKQARFYIAEVILAIEHLHSLDIIHRDLKPENVLLSAQGHCVLTDFGFAKENVVDPDSCSSFCGTLEYMAPEVIKKNRYGKAADWWSVGILLYDMLCGQPPFRHANDAQLYERILVGKLVIPKYFTNQCESLVRGLLQRDIKKRFTVEKIKSHPFFKTINWTQLGNLEISPPFMPDVKKGAMDVTNFDKTLTKMAFGESPSSASASPISNSLQAKFAGFSYARSFELQYRLES